MTGVDPAGGWLDVARAKPGAERVRWLHGDVRDLVGHPSRSLLTVESYLSEQVPAVELSSPVDYFTAVHASLGKPAAVAQRGRDAGAALGARPGSGALRDC